MIVGQFRPENEPVLSIERGPLNKQDILNQIRSDKNKRAELLPGTWEIRNETEDSYEVRIVFNASLRSYDYSWPSNRWASAKAGHVVDIIILRNDAADVVTVLSNACSAPFVLVSTKNKGKPPAKVEKKKKNVQAKHTRPAMAAAAPRTGISSSSAEPRGAEGEGSCYRIQQVDLLELVRRSSYVFDMEYQQELADQGEQLRNLRRITDGWTRDYTHPPSTLERVRHQLGEGWTSQATICQSAIVLPQYKGC
jgi:hypothetical protein